MIKNTRPRDLALLDALDNLERIPIDVDVWRAIHTDRDPLLGNASGGRWEPGLFDVLYASLEPEGAVSELYFHLTRQPVFPSKVTFALNEISVKTNQTLRFADISELKQFGIDESTYGQTLYEQTQLIGDAAYFLGFDGIVAPNARWPCLNMVIFTDQVDPDNLILKTKSEIDWTEWKQRISN